MFLNIRTYVVVVGSMVNACNYTVMRTQYSNLFDIVVTGSLWLFKLLGPCIVYPCSIQICQKLSDLYLR